MHPIYVFDPTANDSLSKVRGVGRYMQILRENMTQEFQFTSALHTIPFESVFINPFFNFLKHPTTVRRIARKQIAVIHDLIPLKYLNHFPVGMRGRIDILFNKWVLTNYDLIITDSEASKKDILSILKINEEKVKVIYPVVAKIFQDKTPTTNLPRRSYQAKAGDQRLTTDYCIYVGDATWNKNLVNLARAIKTANVSCIFVGKIFVSPPKIHPWQRELHEFVEITKNDPRFIFPGFVSDPELIDLYKNAICNILVSKDEGFGFSYVEAATLGVPSILSNIPVLHETARDSASFVSPNDPSEIASGILKMQTDHGYRKTLAQSAKRQSEFFDPTRFKNDLLSICQ